MRILVNIQSNHQFLQLQAIVKSMLVCKTANVPELQIKETNKLQTISISKNLMLIRHLLEWLGNASFLVVISPSGGQEIVLVFIFMSMVLIYHARKNVSVSK